MKSWPPFAAALIVMIGTAIIQGHMTERWGEFPELKSFAERIKKVPTEIGDWRGEVTEQLDARTMNIAGAVESLNLSYKNHLTREVVTVNIVCGRMVDVFSHTPDKCYPSHGFSTMEAPSPVTVTYGPNNTNSIESKFMSAKFLKSDRRAATPVRILWNFSSDGNWDAPDNPKMKFAGQHALYKLYIQHDVREGKGNNGDSMGSDFARVLLPELTKTFFPDSPADKKLREVEAKESDDSAAPAKTSDEEKLVP